MRFLIIFIVFGAPWLKFLLELFIVSYFYVEERIYVIFWMIFRHFCTELNNWILLRDFISIFISWHISRAVYSNMEKLLCMDLYEIINYSSPKNEFSSYKFLSVYLINYLIIVLHIFYVLPNLYSLYMNTIHTLFRSKRHTCSGVFFFD